jgi:hypothetical protein
VALYADNALKAILYPIPTYDKRKMKILQKMKNEIFYVPAKLGILVLLLYDKASQGINLFRNDVLYKFVHRWGCLTMVDK